MPTQQRHRQPTQEDGATRFLADTTTNGVPATPTMIVSNETTTLRLCTTTAPIFCSDSDGEEGAEMTDDGYNPPHENDGIVFTNSDVRAYVTVVNAKRAKATVTLFARRPAPPPRQTWGSRTSKPSARRRLNRRPQRWHSDQQHRRIIDQPSASGAIAPTSVAWQPSRAQPKYDASSKSCKRRQRATRAETRSRGGTLAH